MKKKKNKVLGIEKLDDLISIHFFFAYYWDGTVNGLCFFYSGGVGYELCFLFSYFSLIAKILTKFFFSY